MASTGTSQKSTLGLPLRGLDQGDHHIRQNEQEFIDLLIILRHRLRIHRQNPTPREWGKLTVGVTQAWKNQWLALCKVEMPELI